jgi:signal transduction histidine kinase
LPVLDVPRHVTPPRNIPDITVEVFGCNASQTWLREPDDTYRVVAGTTDLVEEAEALRALSVPAIAVGSLLERLDRQGAVLMHGAALAEMPTANLSRRNRLTHVVYLPIRKGGEMVAMHTAAFRDRTEPLPATTLHLAAGIAQLASLSPETTRLVEALSDADRLKTDFLANLSHELRTPLNVIIGYNDMLLDGACGALSAAQSTVLDRAQQNARELLALMGAALELSRHQGHGLPLNLATVSAAALLDELAGEVSALPALPRVEFAWSVASPDPQLVTDPLKLRMVLKNLIDNARKFTARGLITVAVGPAEGGVELTVSDTGSGIAAEDLPLIFEPFRQLAGGAAPGGVGLGLFLVRRLVEAMGGRVHAESRLGHGSTFRVWLPLSPGR